MDPLTAVVIAFLIFRTGYRIIKEGSMALMDMSELKKKKFVTLFEH